MRKKVFISKVLGMSSLMLVLNISSFIYNVYVSSKTGTLICVEITTSSYKGDVIEAKEICANEIGAEIHFVSAS